MKEKVPRDPLGAFFGFALGIAFLALGIIVLGWVVLTNVAVEKGFDVAMWAAQHSPVPLPVDPVDFGNRVINSPSIWFIAAFGVMALMSAFGFLRGARGNARPAGVSDDGEARLELKGANPRVGETLEGEIVLASKDLVGQTYDIRVECRRLGGRHGSAYRTDYEDSVQVLAVAGAGGARLPFRFEIPLTAPPSRGYEYFSLRDRREWQLVCARKDAWFRGSFFPLQVEPGPEEVVAEALAAMPPVVVGPFQWKLAGGIVGGLFAGGLLLFFVVDALIGFFRKALS